ncbi:hypothetical protein DITRI_Ditri01bG0017800 [Diplodiscus trichospermus]
MIRCIPRSQICGWVVLHYVHGGFTFFLILKTTLALFRYLLELGEFLDSHAAIKDLRLEYVLDVDGVVRSWPAESFNKKKTTRPIKVTAEHVQILNVVQSKPPLMVISMDDASDFVK